MESKFLKQTTALILLTSSILSFSTVAYGETNLQQAIDEVKLEMKRAPLYYVDPALDGVIQPSSTLYSVLNSIKSNYQDVRKDIQKSKLSEREKKLKMKELDALYDEKINKGIVPYIDAYNYAVKYLDPLLKDIIVAQEKNDLQAVEQAYHKLSIQLKSRTSILYRFTGKAPRDLLIAKYKIPANEKRNELIIPVTIYMKVVEAEKLFKSGKKEEAQKILDNIQTLVATLNNQASNEFTKALLKETERVELVVQVPTVPTPTPVPPTNGGSESSGETSSERALRIAKTNAISALTNYKTASDYSAANWIKILDLKSVGNGAINSAATTTKVTQVLTDAKSNIDLVATKVQEEAAQSIIDLISSASTQQQIEEARNAYIQLSSVVKSLVTNEDDLQVKEQNLVNNIATATKVTAKYESAHIGNLVEVDSVPVGFTVSFESSGDESIISNSEGRIVSTGTVNIIFNIIHTLSGKSQITSPILITITPSDTTSLITGINEANSLHSNAVEGTEVGEYAAGSKMLLKDAINGAEKTLNNAPKKTQEELDNATSELLKEITIFKEKVIKAGNGAALDAKIIEAEKALGEHVEGTEVGNVPKLERDKLVQATLTAEVIYSSATTKTQLQLDSATTTLDDAIITFKKTVIKAGNPVLLKAKIELAEQTLDNHGEGIGVGQASKENRDALQEAITVANAVFVDAENKTQVQFDNATTTLELAIAQFEVHVIGVGDSKALGEKITEAEQALSTHVEGTNVGNATIADRDKLAESIATANAVYVDAANKSQLELDNANTILNTAITIFKDAIIKAGDPTALNSGITEATNLHTNAEEGINVGQYVPSSKATLKVAIEEAKAVLDTAATKTTQQLAAAKEALDQAVAEFENHKVVALTGLKDVTITGTANDTSNTVSLNEGETLVLNSSNPSIATVSEAPSGTIKVTGVAAGAPISITVQVLKDGNVTKTGTFTVSVFSEGITSKAISNLDFSTLYATQAKLVSKPVTIGDFTGNRKEFTIVIGQERIPIYIDWKLSADFPKGASMGSVVESHIQDYFYKKYGINGFSIRTIAAFGSSDTFQISTFQTGASSSFTLEGLNWNDFFEQSVAQGTDEDKSKNRTFTISDGTNIATIQLTTKFSTIDTLINQMNTRLKNANVKVQAEKVNESQFKLTLTSSTGELIVDGINKADFFE